MIKIAHLWLVNAKIFFLLDLLLSKLFEEILIALFSSLPKPDKWLLLMIEYSVRYSSICLETRCDLLLMNWFLGTGVSNYFYISFSLCNDFYNCLNYSSPLTLLLGVIFYLLVDKSTLTVTPFMFYLDSASLLEFIIALFRVVPIVMWLYVWVVSKRFLKLFDVLKPTF